MLRRLFLFATTWFVVSIFLVFVIQYGRFLLTPLSATETVQYLFESGSSVHRLVDDLQDRGFIQHPKFFLLLAYCKGATNKLKTGEYSFPPGTTPNQLLNQMLAGNVVLHRFTIVEGWTFQQVMAALNALPYVRHRLNLLPIEQILSDLGLPPRSPEGLFFPATYYFSLGSEDTDLLKRAYQLLERKLNRAWLTRDAGLPYRTPYEALIAASLVERETALAEERPIIAGVIVRRLKSGIPLQIDASLVYGLGAAYTGKLSIDDLHRATAYNTYVHRGLPATPIGMSSLTSIEAVLHPDRGSNLYFVAKGDGSHQFSSDLAQHNLAVLLYRSGRYPKVESKTRLSSLWYLSKTTRHLLLD